MVVGLQVSYDAEHKIWKSTNYEFGEFVNQTVGAAFLKSMRSMKENKVLEYHYDLSLEKTKQQLYEESVTLAWNLRKCGIQKGDVIVLYSLSNPIITSLVMACYLVGAVVNYFDPKMQKVYIREFILFALRPTMIIYEKSWINDIKEALSDGKPNSLKYLLAIDDRTVPNIEETLLTSVAPLEIEHFEAISADPMSDIAALVFTSGSTGEPKLVNITNALLLNGLRSWWCESSDQAQLDVNSVVFSPAPQRWISQIIFQLLPIMGVKRIVSNGSTEGTYGRDIIENCRVTHYFAPPSVFLEVLLQVPEGSKALESLQVGLLAGESPAPALLELCKRKTPNCRFYCCYGMTEICSTSAAHAHINGGKLNPGMQVKILDENLQPVGPNTRGQICLKMPVPLKGYYTLDNSKCLFKDGFFLNGDYGYVDDNNDLHVEGRYKDLIYGEHATLIPNNIEALLMNLPEVQTVRLVGYKRSPGDIKETGVLFVTPKKGNRDSAECLTDKIRKFLAKHITDAEYKDISEVQYTEKMPITNCGKIDRLALKTQLIKC